MTIPDTRPDIQLGATYDIHGNVLTYKDSDGYWHEYARSASGEVLAFENSNGKWYKWMHDEYGRYLIIQHENGCYNERESQIILKKD